MTRLAKHPLGPGKNHRILSVPPGESNPSSHWLWTSDLQIVNASFVVLNHQICDTYHQRPRKQAYDYECVIKYFSYSFSLPNINFLRYYRERPYLFHSCKRVKKHRGSRKKTRKIREKTLHFNYKKGLVPCRITINSRATQAISILSCITT